MALNIRYEGYKVWNMYISPLYDFDNHEFIKNMNEKVAELKEWVDKNEGSDNFDDDFLEKQCELGEWIGEQDFDDSCEPSHIKPEGKIFVNDEELVMDVGETQYFYYEGEERRYEPKEDWYISREYETELALEYESEDEDFDKSKLKWNKDGEGGLEYEGDEDFEDVSGGESNGDEDRIWKITIKGFEYEGEW